MAGVRIRATEVTDSALDAPLAAAVPIAAVPPGGPGTGLLDIQRTAGNAVANQLVVGSVDDAAEVDADRRADRALASLYGAAPAGTGHHQADGVHRSVAPDATVGLDGGPLDERASAEIRAQAGHGRPLDPAIGATFSSALGADISRARIHDDAVADRLARRMSATAFTVGSDVFFSQGSYQPGTPGGDHLLAHELSHVVQGSGGAQRSVVHRAVGFEFETNVGIKKTTSRFLGLGTKKVPLKKMEVIQDYPAEGIRMEADEHSSYGSAIEFVMRPAVEENNRPAMVTALNKLVQLGTLLDQAARPTDGSTATNPNTSLDSIVPSVTRTDVLCFPPGGITANPQATIGVSVNKVHGMLKTAGKAGVGLDAAGDGAANLANTHSTRFADAAATKAELKDRPGLAGLVSLLAAYVSRGSAAVSGGHPLNYAKLISGSVMVRTDFGSYFRKLSDEERTWALGGAAAGDNLIDIVLDVANMPGTGAALVYARGVRKSNKVDKKGKKTNKRSTLNELQISRAAWLRGIARGQDALAAAFARQKAKDELEGLGRLGNRFDQVGPTGTDAGAIMEMREMKQNVPVGEWRDMALSIFDHVVALNAQQDDDGSDSEQAEEGSSESESESDSDSVSV